MSLPNSTNSADPPFTPGKYHSQKELNASYIITPRRKRGRLWRKEIVNIVRGTVMGSGLSKHPSRLIRRANSPDTNGIYTGSVDRRSTETTTRNANAIATHLTGIIGVASPVENEPLNQKARKGTPSPYLRNSSRLTLKTSTSPTW